jgi:hypothetical protein
MDVQMIQASASLPSSAPARARTCAGSLAKPRRHISPQAICITEGAGSQLRL